MRISNTFITENNSIDRISIILTGLMALALALLGAVDKGLEVSCVLALLLANMRQWKLSRQNGYGWLALTFVVAFLAGITSVYIDGAKIFDVPVRYLLAVPFIAMLWRTKSH